MDIVHNLNQLKEEIRTILLKLKRPENDVTLIAVTKNQNLSNIEKVIESGHYILGENRVQEFQEKFGYLDKDVQWHLIGHLQRNKVKFVTEGISLIHSLEKYSLAQEINKRMGAHNKIMNCLVQVNIADEESKYGLEKEEVKEFIEEVSLLPWVKIKGLMTIAPFVENPEEVRPVFKEMGNIFSKLKDAKIPGVEMQFLSMGMTNDYKVAIEEGANLVRIGSAIFGPRI